MSAAVSADPLWQMNGVQVGHGRRLWPQTPLTTTVTRGRTAVLGLSGAGKTSLLDLLVGFTKPDAGTIHAPGNLAWVPQNHGLWTGHTVAEHLTLVGATPAESAALLEAFDLANQASARADQLSLGEAARVAVARALAQKAAVIVMDEPLAHVDSARAGKYWQAIREHLARTAASLVFATHQPEIALAEADHAICLEEGAILYHGSVADLYHAPRTAELARFLGPTNWLSPKEAHLWLGVATKHSHCIRPERLHLRTSADGAAEVIACRFFGSYAETVLRHQSGPSGTFLHRPASALPIGTRITVEEVPRA